MAINNSEEFRDWLKDKPVEWVRVLAARIALRISPRVSETFDRGNFPKDTTDILILSVYRALSISWIACKYPTHDIAAAAAATTSNGAAAVTIANAATNITNANAAITAAITATIATNTSAITSAITAAADTATAATAAAITAAVITATSAEIWTGLNLDIEFLQNSIDDSQTTAQNLADKKLWLDNQNHNSAPDWALDSLRDLERNLTKLDENWHVWIDWYRQILHGQSGWGLNPKNAEQLIVRIATQENKFWDQGATVANAEIAGWLAELREDENITAKIPAISDNSSPSIEEDIKRKLTESSAVEMVRRNQVQLVITAGLLQNEIIEFKEKLRGNNELTPNLKSELVEFLDQHSSRIEKVVAAELLDSDASTENDAKVKKWIEEFIATLQNELPKYTNAKTYGKAVIPSGIVGISVLIGSLVGMPLPFGLTALNMMGMTPLAKLIKEHYQHKGRED